jgi:hypothetical protein
MKCYKLTDQKMQTYNSTQWGDNITHTANGQGDLCGPGWLHAYTSPLLAVLLNPIHANTVNPILWEAEGTGDSKNDRGLKIGFTSLTTVRTLPIPVVTLEQKIRFAILCGKQINTDPNWNAWADNWLSGTDRSEAAARTTVRTTVRAARAAAWAAAEAVAEAAEAAAEAARAAEAAAEAAARAAEAAAEAAARTTVRTTVRAAEAAAEAAARTTVRTTVRAARAATIDFIALAEQACS